MPTGWKARASRWKTHLLMKAVHCEIWNSPIWLWTIRDPVGHQTHTKKLKKEKKAWINKQTKKMTCFVPPKCRGRLTDSGGSILVFPLTWQSFSVGTNVVFHARSNNFLSILITFSPVESIQLYFFPNLSPVTGSCVGPQNKIGHPAHRYRQLMQVPVLIARGI